MKKILIALLFIMAAFGLFAEVLITDSFDAATFPPTGWTNTAITGTYSWERSTAGVHPVITPHSGAAFAMYQSWSASAGNAADMATPSFSATTGFVYSVTFWMYRDTGYATNADMVRVYTNSSATSTGGSLVGTINRSTTLPPTVAAVGWYSYTFEFTPVATGGNSFIIFNALSAYGNDMYIDDVQVSRLPNNTPPLPAIIVSPANNAVGVMTSATLNWMNGGGGPTDYNVYFGTTATPPFVVNQTATTYTPTLALNTTYYWQIVPHNANGNATGCPIWTFQTGGPVVNMSNGSQTVADGISYSFFDSGGPTAPYQNDENFTFTFTAATATAALQCVFNSFNTEEGYDYLKIYDGPNATSPQIGPTEGYNGPDDSPGTFMSTGNSLTFVFTSDVSVTPDGWAAVISAMSGGSLAGTVTSGGNPLAGVTVTINNTTYETTTTATGTYSFPFVPAGTYTVTFSKIGYATQTLPATIVMNQATTLNAIMVALPVVNVTGTVFGSDAPTVGLVGATVDLVGAVNYSGTTNASGAFTITGVLSGSTYAYTISKLGYTNATGNITVGTTNYTMAPVTLNEISLPAGGVQAAENAGHTAVNVTWMAPGTGGGEWIRWDSGENNDSIGLTSGGTFDVAARWPAADLTDFVGMSVYAINFFPGDTATYSMRVWTGGSATAPGTLVCDQAVPTYTVDDFNTVLLTTPVPIQAGQELWIGFTTTHTAGLFPAGCDAGPAHDGFGNWIYTSGSWATLYSLAPTLNYDWNLSGYVGYSAPTAVRISQLPALPNDLTRYNNDGIFAASGTINKLRNATVLDNVNDIRTLQGYKVWRLLQGQETNEALWTQLTPNTITATAYSDAGWATVTDGQYKWAVKAIYTNNVMSVPAFSNMIQKLTQVGTIAGIVRSTANVPISGAVVTAGTYTATTNTSGAYSMQVPAGTYTVTAAHAGFTTGTQNGVVVVTGQTTTVNFNLGVATTVEDGFETYTNFTIDFAPWVNNDVDASTTYSYNGYTWENAQAAQAFMVFNPSATTPPSTDVIGTPHAGAKMATCWADVLPAQGGTGPNNDWLISQIFNVGPGASISFYAKSMTDEYGLERFKVGFSTGATTPASFTILSGANYVSAPVEWTLYTYELPAGTTGNVRVGVNCISQDAFCFQLDDVVMNLGGVANEDNNTPVVTTALNGCYPNPFNPNTTISYSVKATTPVTVEIYNAKGQKVRTLVNETKAEGNHKITWNGKDDKGANCTSGVYFYKMNAGKFSSSKKMILMK